MEEALVELKTKYNELLRENMDAADGPTTVKIASANDEVMQLKEELKKREVAHSERIVEMVCKMQICYEYLEPRRNLCCTFSIDSWPIAMFF